MPVADVARLLPFCGNSPITSSFILLRSLSPPPLPSSSPLGGGALTLALVWRPWCVGWCSQATWAAACAGSGPLSSLFTSSRARARCGTTFDSGPSPLASLESKGQRAKSSAPRCPSWEKSVSSRTQSRIRKIRASSRNRERQGRAGLAIPRPPGPFFTWIPGLFGSSWCHWCFVLVY